MNGVIHLHIAHNRLARLYTGDKCEFDDLLIRLGACELQNVCFLGETDFYFLLFFVYYNPAAGNFSFKVDQMA